MDLSKGFMGRLQSLQRLCSNVTSSSEDVLNKRGPSGLLFVPGIDGRNNKGSLTILKYLFEGSCGRDLLEGNQPDFLEKLEEMVLLVQESSVSVLYTSEMRQVLLPWLDNLAGSLFIEYMPSAEEEDNIDRFQEWKCVNFKRMMMEAVPAGCKVGIPIPLGYDGTADVEDWPLLQAFALDSVYHATGFFTSRYNVVDLTEYLDVLYRSIDASCVHQAVETMRLSSFPHAIQSIELLDSSAEQRSRRTAEDVLGPLEMLFEFGELHCAEPVDPNLRPVLLLGTDTQHFSMSRSQLPRGWESRQIGAAQHMIVEACEPSTGMRWCRTYLLHRGRCLDFLKDLDALVDDSTDASGTVPGGTVQDDDDDDNAQEQQQQQQQPTVFGAFATITAEPKPKAATKIAASLTRAINRMEALYAKLWLSLRWAVRVAFECFSDVLEAGTFLQATLDELMRGNANASTPHSSNESVTITLPSGETRTLQYPPDLNLLAVSLIGAERLQVHMDCLNALGRVVTIDDIDDMGGSCWTYVRVAVHGVLLEGKTKSHEERRGCVAVGDTFLFSIGAQKSGNASSSLAASTSPSHNLLTGDSFCLTHSIPYYRCLVGPGVEDASARQLQASTRSTHMLSALGLGKLVETNGGYERSSLTLPALTDHPLLPHCNAAIKIFTAGLLVEKFDVPCLPMMLSIGAHVERMWSMDFNELCAQASNKFAKSESILAAIQHFRGTEGVLLLFKTKSFTSASLEKESASRRRAAQDDADRQTKELAARQARRAAGILADDDDDADGNDADEGENSAGAGKNLSPAETSSTFKHQFQTDALSDGLTPMQRSLQFNPLQRCLPNLPGSEDGPRYFALLVFSSSRAKGAISAATSAWRAALRMNDAPEHRGSSSSSAPLPDSILSSFAVYLDSRSYEPEYTDSVVQAGVVGDRDGITIDPAVALELDSVSGRGCQASAGLLGLEVTFSLAEARRAASLKGGCAVSSGANGVETVNTHLVVVTGHPGSGIGLLGPHLSERIERALRSGDYGEFSPDRPLCSSLHLDLTRGNAGGAKAIETAWQSARSDSVPKPHVLVVTVVQPPSQQAALGDTLTLLSRLAGGGVVSAVVGVVCPGGINGSSYPLQHLGIGEELWRATCLEPLHAGQACDLVLCTDPSPEPSKDFDRLRAWLSNANPQAVCVRAARVRVEEEQLQVILSKLGPIQQGMSEAGGNVRAKNRSICFRRPECVMSCFAPPLASTKVDEAVSKPCRFSLTQMANGPAAASLRCLRTLSAPTPPGGEWSLPCLLLLLQHLFPNAPVSSTITDTWRIPENTRGETGLRRAITLTSSKVLAGRQKKHERSNFSSLLVEEGKRGRDVSRIVRSVHGTILVVRQDKTSGATTGQSLATIEACTGCILIRHSDYDEASSKSPVESISLTGVLRDDDCSALLTLFSHCRPSPLPRKAPFTRQDLSNKELLELQKEDPTIVLKPLPSGWFSDGVLFWGPNGVTNCGQELRPDIEEICTAVLARKNEQVTRYNSMLDDLDDISR